MNLADSGMENKSKLLDVIFYVERIGSCSPRVNRISDLTVLQIPVSDTDSAQGERYRSSDFILNVLFCFLLI